MKTRNLSLSEETLSYLDNMEKITGGSSVQNTAICLITPLSGCLALSNKCVTLDSKCITFNTYKCDPTIPVQDKPCS